MRWYSASGGLWPCADTQSSLPTAEVGKRNSITPNPAVEVSAAKGALPRSICSRVIAASWCRSVAWSKTRSASSRRSSTSRCAINLS